MTSLYQELKQALDDEELVALVNVMSGAHEGLKVLVWPDGRTSGDLARLPEEVGARMPELFRLQRSERLNIAGSDIFVEVYPPPPKLVMVGAVHVAQPLVRFAKILGFRTIVIDPRAVFATSDRFPQVDQLMVEWPEDAFEKLTINEATYIVTLSHDSKLDNPALEMALRSRARYVGAIGSKRTHQKRIAALKEMGVADEQIARIHGPIGLSIGAKGAEEIAVSIIAEIVAATHGIDPLEVRQLAVPPLRPGP